VIPDGLGDLIPALADRQLGGIGDGRHGRAARGPSLGAPGLGALIPRALISGTLVPRTLISGALISGASRAGAPGSRRGWLGSRCGWLGSRCGRLGSRCGWLGSRRGWLGSRCGWLGSRLGGRGELSLRRHHGSRLHTGRKNKPDWPPLANTFSPLSLPGTGAVVLERPVVRLTSASASRFRIDDAPCLLCSMLGA
jgi:hypothetical protein